MSDANPTLADMLPDDIEGLGDQIKAQIGEQKGAVPWSVVEGEAIGGLKSELGKFDLFGLLGQAWSKARELRGYRDPAAQPKEPPASSRSASTRRSWPPSRSCT